MMCVRCVSSNESALPIYTKIGPYKHSGTKFCFDNIQRMKFCIAIVQRMKFCMANI